MTWKSDTHQSPDNNGLHTEPFLGRASVLCFWCGPGEPGRYPTQSMLEPRLHIEFASGSALAAILRRGPTDWTRLLLWDTSTDHFEVGSWFHGRIYDDCCSISPDGQLFAYLLSLIHI